MTEAQAAKLIEAANKEGDTRPEDCKTCRFCKKDTNPPWHRPWWSCGYVCTYKAPLNYAIMRHAKNPCTVFAREAGHAITTGKEA